MQVERCRLNFAGCRFGGVRGISRRSDSRCRAASRSAADAIGLLPRTARSQARTCPRLFSIAPAGFSMRADLRRLSWREVCSGCSMRGRIERHGSTAARGLAALPNAVLDENKIIMRGFSHRTSKIYSFPLPQFIFELRMTIYAIDLIFATEAQRFRGTTKDTKYGERDLTA